MKKTRLVAVASGVVLAVAAQLAAAAKGPEYTYAELGYVYSNGDDIDGNGFDANISFGATDLIFLKFGYQRDWLDVDGVDPGVDANKFLIGGGAHYTVMDKLDLVGSLSYVDIEYSGIVPSQGDDGYEAALGVRSMLSKDLELNGFVSYVTTGNVANNDDSDTVYSLGGVYKLNKDFSLVGNLDFSDVADQYGVGVRLAF
jgi:hypothetical protein